MIPALLLIPSFGIVLVLIFLYNSLVVHWADANEPWNRYQLILRKDDGQLIEGSNFSKFEFNNYARAKETQSRMEQLRFLEAYRSKNPVYFAFEYVVFDHKTREVV